MTAYSFPYTPGPVSGNWQVNLPPDACIGEVILYATAPEADPWDAPTAPPGTTITVAVTFVTPGGWIAGDGLSMVTDAVTIFTKKILFRTTRHSGPPASPLASWSLTQFTDPNADGSYTGTGYTSGTGTVVMDWDYYGPGDTLPEGSTVPADAGAVYIDYRVTSYVERFGPSDAITGWQDDVPNGYWSTGSPPDVYHQRFDDVTTHTEPMWPYLLP